MTKSIKLMIMITFLFCGCASTWQSSDNVSPIGGKSAIELLREKVPLNQSYLFVFRKAGFGGSMTAWPVHLNNKKVGMIKNGGFMLIKVPPGEHYLFPEEHLGIYSGKKETHKVNVSGGRRYFYSHITQGGLTLTVKFNTIGEHKAAEMIAQYKVTGLYDAGKGPERIAGDIPGSGDVLKMNTNNTVNQDYSKNSIVEKTGSKTSNAKAVQSNGKWVEDEKKASLSDETKEWIKNNQNQVNRSENQQTRDILKKDAKVNETEPATVIAETEFTEVKTFEDEVYEKEDDSYYVPLPEAYSFIPTEKEKKQWAATRAQLKKEREAEITREKKEYRTLLAKNHRNQERYSMQLAKDTDLFFNNKVSTTVINHGSQIIDGAKIAVGTAACLGPQAAVTCAPVVGAMASYGRFDSLAAGIGEGTAELQKSGDFSTALTTGVQTGALDYMAGKAGEGIFKGKGIEKSVTQLTAKSTKKKAYKKTAKASKKFIFGHAGDHAVKKKMYSRNKLKLTNGLKELTIGGYGATAGKNSNGKIEKSNVKPTGRKL